MTSIYSPENLPTDGPASVGGKGHALLAMHAGGLPVPPPICISTGVYDRYVDHNRLRERIGLELYRKNIEDMRWEEIWDASLRIQHLFMQATLPKQLEEEILEAIRQVFGNQPLAIRSSAPEEDGAGGSFAGLHESYVNVVGQQDILKKIKKVWASLWSDRAILYRQELRLEILRSRMAVVIQPFVAGDVSGVLFTRSPFDESQMVLEAVHGINQGLVDGEVEPDRWLIDRKTGKVAKHTRPEQRDLVLLGGEAGGVRRSRLDQDRRNSPPLDTRAIEELVQLGLEVERVFGAGQDIEWTFVQGSPVLLQSRPITAGRAGDAADKRSWYLSLTRSYDNLVSLRERIACTLIPQMDDDAEHLSQLNLEELSDAELALEIERRFDLNEKWTSVYWSDFIPFAHGVRLFGEVYNEVVEPRDPFEFVSLLCGQKMLSTRRNELLLRCARIAAKSDHILEHLKRGVIDGIEDSEFQASIHSLRHHFSTDAAGIGVPGSVGEIIAAMILQYTYLENGSSRKPGNEREALEKAFLDKARHTLSMEPAELLSLARESYRLRDDDNIHLGRIGQELERAVRLARQRLRAAGKSVGDTLPAADLCRMLRGKLDVVEWRGGEPATAQPPGRARARQLQGQPASRGMATGSARVITVPADLSAFKKGEVLVIDSIDPTMTFFAPLAAAIVERRGGMLIHGAIIAREYGIPCVTGVVGATELIRTGDRITVDGYLGICTLQKKNYNS
jgi:pyruvate,water dikinase